MNLYKVYLFFNNDCGLCRGFGELYYKWQLCQNMHMYM